MIDENHIRYESFIDNEIQTLATIRGLSGVEASFPDLANQANVMHGIYSKQKKGARKFVFGCQLEMMVEKRNQLVFVEAQILPNYSLATYALSLCSQESGGWQLLRKFHFDYDPQQAQISDRKPKFHIQYAGGRTPKLDEHKISLDPLHKWLSVPRISTAPMCLGLLLDLIFAEFSSETTQKIIENPEWRKMIVSNERNVVQPYFQAVTQFLSSSHKSSYLLREFVYGR